MEPEITFAKACLYLGSVTLSFSIKHFLTVSFQIQYSVCISGLANWPEKHTSHNVIL